MLAMNIAGARRGAPLQKRIPLHLMYFFVSNVDVLIPYERFTEISPAHGKRDSLFVKVSQLRLLLGPLGFYVLNISGKGYKCIRLNKGRAARIGDGKI